MAAPASPFASLDYIGGHYIEHPQSHKGTYVQLNHYHIEEDYQGRWNSNCVHLTPEAGRVFNKVVEIMRRDHWDHSDAQIDYFSTNFYLGITVGKWNRNFVIK